MPYAEDEAKRVRYRAFLELKAGLKSNVPERKAGHSMGDWRKELYEFAQAAEVFKPMTGLMASRFTSSTKVYEGGDSDRKAGSSPPAPKQEDPAEAAARMGMYGPMTRSVQTFYPMRLVCKRFGVKPPAHVVTDPGEAGRGRGGIHCCARACFEVCDGEDDEGGELASQADGRCSRRLRASRNASAATAG